MAQALALCEQLLTAQDMTREQVDNAFHQIVDDDRAQFLLLAYPIPSLWGHPAGAGASPADAAFINDHVARFMAGTLHRQNPATPGRRSD